MLKKLKSNPLVILKYWQIKTIFLFFCITYLISAFLFAEERVIILDNALHIFDCIVTEKPGIMAGRWPIAMVRVPLVVGIYFNLPLDHLLDVYSLSHALLIVGIGITIYKYTHQDNLKLFLLTYLLIVGHTFFWCVSEIIPALLLATLFFNSEGMHTFIKYLLIIIIVFSHPQSIIALTFLFTYQLLFKASRKSSRLLLFSVLIFLIKSLWFPNWYDSMKMGVLTNGLRSDPFSFIYNDALHQFYSQSSIWIPLLMLAAIITVYLIYNGKWSLILYYLSFLLGSIYLFLMSNPNHISDFYTESNLYLLSFMSGIILLDYCKNQKHIHLFIWICFIMAIWRVGVLSTNYKHRLNYIRAITNQLPFEKNIVEKTTLNQSLMQLDWGLPFETLIISSLNKTSGTKTLIAANEQDLKKLSEEKMLLNGMGGSFKIPFDQSYFELDTGEYHIISLEGIPEMK